ncbi:hypothetical protein [Edaphovirga cremea]|uniref:hypothetical protein n=1 Tax=Edaphovirga cremea TaxID=2267246 RepID=UPI000DEF45CE|nr:hypothetical protein [Edaphovirga cremea]
MDSDKHRSFFEWMKEHKRKLIESGEYYESELGITHKDMPTKEEIAEIKRIRYSSYKGKEE